MQPFSSNVACDMLLHKNMGRRFFMAAEPIRDKKVIKQLVDFYLDLKQWRNYVLIVLGLNTALRISDLLALRWGDVYDVERKRFRKHLTLTEGKTKKTKTVALNKAAITALQLFFPHRRAFAGSDGGFIFANNRANAAPIGRTQAHRIIKKAAQSIRVVNRISCHSLRKTFGYHAWKSGAAVSVIMDIFNHSSYEITRRYLGIAQDDRDKVYMGIVLL
jgi:integrase